MEGQILGNRYLLLEKIGGGGMAVVYKAKCTLLNRFVAVKVLRTEFTNDDEFVKRFKIEAQAVASLSHPNVVSIYDVGHQDDIHYIVMEYVDGMTLKDYLNKHGALNWNDAVKITIQICSAIEHAHKNNIVHRDIKPHNILLTKEGIAKVTDFGIARAVTSSTITMVGSTIGSVHYFSPEQARGGFIDEKSDLYSLGIALYEMVTGKVPFDGDSPVAVALKHIQETPLEPHKLVPSLPYGVNEIIMKAIQKEQNVRYQSATEMLSDLNTVLVQPQGGFIGHNSVSSQSTIRMRTVNSDDIDSTVRVSTKPTNVSNKKYESEKQKKKNNTTYWLAGIASVLVIGLLLFITISLLTKGTPDNKVNTMPDYRNKRFEEIKDDLVKRGINYTENWQDNDAVEKGIIFNQSVEPGAEYRNGSFTNLELSISNGPKSKKVPDVINKDYRDAQSQLESQDIKYKIEEEFNESVKADYVIRTEPKANEEIKDDTVVTIFVSKGVEVKLVKVPNLVGKTESVALKLLKDAKLSLGSVLPAGTTNGIVNRQAPEAYSEVAPGETVTIWLTPQEQQAPPSSSQSQPSDTQTSGNTGGDTKGNGKGGKGNTSGGQDTSGTQQPDNGSGDGDNKTNPDGK
ncbi:serine/threonine protein kinase with PASTA sensor(s) [Ruminiclostridium papyrosolvens DSM 2782]|uniref:non-specific serine/threonine protein kinase n=1 Tax=Ruminiclostridium papyrosolvens DSM 2782 TaxID=588581 RepID=F1TDL2_9FIRM|nr:Stk1 family PASTA domain-containing Ser/Thr kinase [Ruminiclostridium papyrosolvens]EGD47650.1 serine/threonine protein kinase with PASTA sensor(s) [Ruminiclostridium papyrosolvens DSM 2782]WES36406.1 Stk1 family PASTA domain-containing Ser/Thr kinase [Ruminiclostridium papyrosolvens DSM 2782]